MPYISTWDIETTLNNQLLTVVGLPTFKQENEGAAANDTQPFCRSTLMPAERTAISIGTNPIFGQPGLYQVDLFYPQGYGFRDSKNMADAVSNAFPQGTLLMQDAVSKLIILSASVFPSINSRIEGSFVMVPIRVRWVINA